ncbi:MAG: response regulator [Micavibrio sp.]|nr:response regulator [Micavibrio sp.]
MKHSHTIEGIMFQPATQSAISAKTILVVEDEVLIRLLVCDYLRTAGFAVVEAGNADEAMTHLNAANNIAVIFSDVRMPGSMDGVEFMSRVSTDRPDIKLILTSAHLSPSELPRDMGDAVHLIPKPYRLAEVALAIHTHLHNHFTASNASSSPE